MSPPATTLSGVSTQLVPHGAARLAMGDMCTVSYPLFIIRGYGFSSQRLRQRALECVRWRTKCHNLEEQVKELRNREQSTGVVSG